MRKKFNSSGFILAFIAALKVLNFFKIDSQKRERKTLETQIKIFAAFFENSGRNWQNFLRNSYDYNCIITKWIFF